MEAVEFVTRIEDGKIEVPEQYRGRVGVEVRVILLEREPARRPDAIDRLLQEPLKVAEPGFLSREEIYSRPISE